MGNDASAGQTAVWALTRDGWLLARRVAEALERADCHVPRSLDVDDPAAGRFDRLSSGIHRVFHDYSRHVFIMSAGIVVRLLAPVIRHKTRDPAVVVVDEAGRFVISLLSGHVGGANRFAEHLAARLEATPVITTATDVRGLPAVDEIAVRNGLFIENPAAIKTVSMALLNGRPLACYDPFDMIRPDLDERVMLTATGNDEHSWKMRGPGIAVDDTAADWAPDILVLRPPTLVAGMGCNRGTSVDDLRTALETVLGRYRLSIRSLDALATAEIKRDEAGLSALAAALGVPVYYYTTADLDSVAGSVETPSDMVEKHIGVKSVCEAAAILGSQQGDLIVPKQKTPDVTVAIARKRSTS